MLFNNNVQLTLLLSVEWRVRIIIHGEQETTEKETALVNL
jgi:hypothetical protein